MRESYVKLTVVKLKNGWGICFQGYFLQGVRRGVLKRCFFCILRGCKDEFGSN